MFPLSRKKTAFSAPFLVTSWQKFCKSALAFFGRNFLHWRKFHKTQFKYFFKDVRDFSTIFSRLNLFSGHSIWKVQTSFGKFLVARLIKKFWVHFPKFCVSQQTCLPWSSDTFFELSASKVYKNVLGAFSQFLRAKTKLLAVKTRCILEVFTLQVKKISGHIFSIFASKNEGICREVQMHFGSSLPAGFTEKVVGAISRFMCPKTKRFAVEFRRILEVFALPDW